MTILTRGFAALLFAGTVYPQNGPTVFEVVSVKLSTGDGPPDLTPRRSGERITMHSVRFPSLVIYAYHLEHGLATTSYQLTGHLQLPEGLETYDIDAIAPVTTGDQELRAMFQHLLKQRFHLRAHWESKVMPVYDLAIAKNGARLKPASKVSTQHPRESEHGVSHLYGNGISFEQFVEALTARLELPLRNRAGLSGGSYNVDLRYARDGNLDEATSAPDLITAVEQELGLKLRRSRGPIPVLVVDHVEKPSEN